MNLSYIIFNFLVDDKKGPAKNEKSPEKLDNRHKGDRPKKEEKR